MSRFCASCGKKLSPLMRSDARYCSTRCRVRAYDRKLADERRRTQ